MTSGPCLRGCRVVRRYMPTNIGNHSSVVKDECNNYVSMYFEPLQPLGPVNTGVPPSGGTYVPQTQVIALPLPAERYPPRRLPPEQQRQYTLDMLLALVGGLAEQQPVLVIVEDLHWVDPSMLELLARLIDQVPTARIYAVLTCRSTFQPSWGHRTHLTPLALNRLTPPSPRLLVGKMLGGKRLPAVVLEQIVAKTDGIPLF